MSPCPKKVGDLVAVLARHLELAPLAAVPRPDFVQADDLRLRPTAAVADWKRPRPRRQQVEMAIQGRLARAVTEPLKGETSNRVVLID